MSTETLPMMSPTRTPQPIDIRIAGLTKCFGKATVVDDLTLEIPRGNDRNDLAERTTGSVRYSYSIVGPESSTSTSTAKPEYEYDSESV